MTADRFVRVALDVPLDTPLDYLADNLDEDDLGRRVAVSLGRKTVVGIAVSFANTTTVPEERLKPITNVFRDDTRLSADIIQIIEFASRYYQHAFGQSLMAAVPPALRRPRELWCKEEILWRITSAGREAVLPARQTRAARVLKFLRDGIAKAQSEILRDTIAQQSTLKTLQAQGYVAQADTLPIRTVGIRACGESAPTLNPQQSEAVEAVASALGAYRAWLLHGITGSGKTEVYLQLVARVIAKGGQALVLVPEIGLTPQLEQRFRARFAHVPQVSLHSALADVDRARRWLDAATGRAQIVLGTRLSVFTPLPNLALIVVDEEQDASFKQQEGLRYSARDLAVFRAKLRGVPIVLGSATPSIESYYHGRSSHYTMLPLRTRARADAKLPGIQLVDIRRASVEHGIAQDLALAVEARLQRGEQSLIFINRRGYAPAIYCPQCAWFADCPRCSVKLVFHRTDRRMRCHHCGYAVAPAPHCPTCGNTDLRPVGIGTQRIEEALQAKFPQARVLRIDRDTVRSAQSLRRTLKTVDAGGADILIGTQLLAKGHDFPRITLVGILNVDAALYSPDFRATERLFALILQVAGRAGRGQLPGEVLVQTEFPYHPALQYAVAHDYEAFAQVLLAERQKLGFPPFVHQAVLRMEAQDSEAARAFAARACELARGMSTEIALFDPVTATIAKIAGRTRLQVLTQCASRMRLQTFLGLWLKALRAEKANGVRWAIDVDPYEL